MNNKSTLFDLLVMSLVAMWYVALLTFLALIPITTIAIVVEILLPQ